MKIPIRLKRRTVLLLILFILILVPLALAIAWLATYHRLYPAVKFSRPYKDRIMSSPTVFLDRNNKQLGSIGGSSDFQIHAISLQRNDLSTLSQILFAKEDRKIREFDGIQGTGLSGFIEASFEVISWRGKIRAFYQTFGGNTQGASGLLEQIAGNLFGHEDQNPWFESGILSQIERKAVKTINAIRLAHLYQSSEQVVEDYVNLTYTAGMYHGINAFMLKRFDRNIDQILVPIDLSRPYLPDNQIDIINMLAYYVGQLTGPANYDPGAARNPLEYYRIVKRAEFKKNLVLDQMYTLGMIRETIYLNAKDRKLPFKEGDIAEITYDPNIEVLRQETIDRIKINLGGNIETTLIKEVQDLTNYELLKQRTLLSIKATHSYFPSSVPSLKTIRPERFDIFRVKVVRRNKEKVVVNLGIRMGEREVSIPARLDAESMQHFLPGKYISVGVDDFDDNGLPVLSLIQKDSLIKGAVILKSLSNGQVVAFGGGGYLKASISPGSAFKPFLLKLAFDYGWQLEDRLNNSCHLQYRLLSGPFYSPQNYGRCDESKANFDQFPDVKTVLKKSINKPVVYLLDHLTDQLTDNKFNSLSGRFIKDYNAAGLEPMDYVYLIGEKRIDFFLVTDDGGKQFIGKIPLVGLKNSLIFERLKREKYLALNESNQYLEAAEVMNQDFEAFMRWHSALDGARDQFESLKRGLEQYQNGQVGKRSETNSEVALLDHFYYRGDGRLYYDPYSRDKITFINWELVKEFLSRRSLAGVHLKNFTVDDHIRYENWVEEFKQEPDADFFREMIHYHPQFRGLLNIELFKEYLAELTDTERSTIKGDYSLPLGTHRVSLVELSNMYGQILTGNNGSSAVRNNQTHFIKPDQRGMKNTAFAASQTEFVLNDQSKVFEALLAARQERGGTSSHLKSKAIIAGKTGTDPKYKTYVAVVEINGFYYLAAAYFGVDLNKHEKLVKSWTGGWTAAVFIDQVVTDIQKQYLNLFPRSYEATIEFDPNFEYDSTNDSPESDGENSIMQQSPEESPQEEPTVIWQTDGTYRLERKGEPQQEQSGQEKEKPTVEMDYSEEEINQAIQEE